MKETPVTSKAVRVNAVKSHQTTSVGFSVTAEVNLDLEIVPLGSRVTSATARVYTRMQEEAKRNRNETARVELGDVV